MISRLDVFRREKGEVVSVSEIEALVLSLLADETESMSSADLVLYEGLQSLSGFISTMRQEIVALRPQEISREYIPAATDELDAIIESTETATNVILDATEVIEQLQGQLPSEAAAVLSEATTKIYEACNFQDITGQRINKIVGSLREIEMRVFKLTETFDSARQAEVQAGEAAFSEAEKTEITDQDLLNGPQLPDKAKKQDEVDALFSRDK